MAFQTKDLSVLGYANGFTLWHYTTPDTGNQIRAAGYFNNAVQMLRVGDFMVANAGVGTATPANGLLCVASNTGTVVDLTDLTPVGAANTD